MTPERKTLEPPALLTRRVELADGHHRHEAWCPWCEKLHHHGEGAGGRAPHCADYDGRSPLARTGYSLRVVQAIDACENWAPFPTSRGYVGARRFWRAIGLSASALRKAVVESIFAKKMRGNAADFKIARTTGTLDARASVGLCAGRLRWSIAYSDGETSEGSDLAALAGELFALPYGVAGVRIYEAATGAELDAEAALDMQAVLHAWQARGFPRNNGRRA
jgi:hypothetical protein